MIITSQLPVAEWHNYLNNNTIEDAILDRVVYFSHRIELEGESMTFAAGCSNTQKHIAFDHLARPHNGINTATNNYSKYMTSDCIITISFIDSSITNLNITVAAETGYASGD